MDVAAQQMDGQEDIDQTPNSNDAREDIHENTSQKTTIEQSKTQYENMEVHHHPNVEKKNFKEYSM